MQKLNLQSAGLLKPCFAPGRPSHKSIHHQRQSCLRVSASASVTEKDAAVQNGVEFQIKDVFPPTEPKPVSPEVQAIIDEQGLDYETSGLKYLTNEARMRALDKKANKVEKLKNKKGGEAMWSEVHELGQLIREGKTTWQDLALDDIDLRLKWSGLFHRRKKTPGFFMMRLKVPNGELNSEQLRFLGESVGKYGEKGCLDITTRANIQLRGIPLEDAGPVFAGLQSVGLSSVQTGMDNVRNMTGSPIAGIDPHEFIDSRPLCKAIDNMITNHGKGNPELVNLPRKINIGISSTRDDFAHTHINDVGLYAAKDPETGKVGFNVELGGYFSIKRNARSIPGDTWLDVEEVAPYCKAILEVFRDYGQRVADRQKTRLMWLVEDMGAQKFRETVSSYIGYELKPGKHVTYDDEWKRRDVLGVHPQRQEGLYWVGACVPVGRMTSADMDDLAHVADTYGDGTLRLTVEQDVIFPNVPEANLEAMQKEPLFQRFQINPGNLSRGLVSCTGAQFCGVAIIETKNRAMAIVEKLEQQLDIPEAVRIHWTGCPNSCGQAQVGDIGLMGGPAKLDGKAVEGVRLFRGGIIGENPTLATEFEKGVPCEERILLPKLRELLIQHHGAKLKPGVDLESEQMATATA
ncbi:hypothetical protein ABBQ32_004808 [Trebouxia sp. C0010 RCD-2024]